MHVSHFYNLKFRILDGVVAVVTRLWTGRFGVWFSAGARDFTVVQNVNTGSVAYGASCLLGVGGCYTGGKLASAWSLTIQLHLLSRFRNSSRMPELYSCCMPLWHAQELRRLLHNATSSRSIDRLLRSYFSCSMLNIPNQSEETFTAPFTLYSG
jgi:hypothetical protein